MNNLRAVSIGIEFDSQPGHHSFLLKMKELLDRFPPCTSGVPHFAKELNAEEEPKGYFYPSRSSPTAPFASRGERRRRRSTFPGKDGGRRIFQRRKGQRICRIGVSQEGKSSAW
jgi:hypothetical protein